MTTNTGIYQDIATRTAGDIYIGVVGPVRAGKSTFIKRFMETQIIPNIDNVYRRERAKDELPQSGSGRTVMTSEPKFVPEEAVDIALDEGASCSVRLIDCVGYMVPGAAGQLDGDSPRMVTTPWADHPVTMAEAAELGTTRVIREHSTIGIDRNVGAMSEHLSRLRTKPEYFAFKKAYHNALSGSAAGRALYRFNHSLKTGLKKAMLPNATMFEDMGFAYLGPVDGHDLAQLTTTLEWAREMKRPVLVHVRTQKGHGYAPAEREPWKFHGVGPFDAATGAVPPAKESFSSVFGAALTELAEEDPRVCAITAAMEDGTGLTPFAGRFPDRFFDVGIAEGHAAAMAAGLAKQGALPVFAVYSSFLQRAYDQLLHDVALSGLHVVFAVDRAGLVGADGATHHGVMDTVFLSGIPNMTVLCPASFAELRAMLRRALFEMTGPVAIRYPRGGEGAFTADTSAGDFAELRTGKDITLCAYGTLINNVLGAAELLHEDGIEARVVKLNRISPFRGGELSKCFGTTKRLLVAEECLGVGCIGQRIAAILAEEGHELQRLMLCNLGRRFIEQGSVGELYRQCGLDAESLARTAKEVCQ